MKFKFTDAAVARIKPPERGQVSHWDILQPGFGLLVSAGGTKTWQLNTRVLRAGKWGQTRISLGHYPAVGLADARERARLAEQAAKNGDDPRGMSAQDKAAKVAASKSTFMKAAQDFMRLWVEARGLRKATSDDYKRVLFGDDVSDWQSRPISSISRRDVREKLAEIAATRPVRSNRYLAYWSRFFGWCLENDRIDTDPTDGVKKPSIERQGERVLTFDEIGELLNVLNHNSVTHQMIRLLLLSGQRRDEIARLRWDEVRDLDGADPRIELPGERCKNHRPHIIPLSLQAAEIIKNAPRIVGCEFVFSTTGETPVSGYSRAKKTIDAAINAARKKNKLKPMQPWTLHDLRRTFATHAHETLGVEPHVVEAVLNHISGTKAGVAGTYNRAAYLAQRRAALQAWADRLAALTS